ncbi:iron-containing alcohol dehydrogenase, partial [Bacillus thuringiensis]|nr:iron-containing alcohol dehydrogenase [Bacillus thuringiensis]
FHLMDLVRPQRKLQLSHHLHSCLNSDIVGKSAQYIADLVGITVPGHTKMLVAEIQGIGAAYPLSREKLSPVLACVKANSLEEGFTYCEEMLNLGGLGHSAVIHSTNKDVQKQFGLRMKACRLIVNAPSSQGGIGDIYNGFIPSLTLGCGSYGKNSVSQNVTATHLLNIKRLANRKKNMQWFKLPPKIYFEKHATAYLANMPNISRAFIVTDSGMVEHGYVDTVAHYLNKNANDVKVEVFFEVEPDPSDET